jgi:thiol:disulfide interchange protein DsbD
MATALGLFFGLSACTVSCLPYLAPVFLASDGGIRRSWSIVLPFSLGRLFSYGSLGLAAALAGRYLGDSPAGEAVGWISGMAAILVGGALLLRSAPGCGGACASPAASGKVDSMEGAHPEPLVHVPLHASRRDPAARALLPGGLFLMGAGMALSPCAPLGTVLFSAALLGRAADGLALGLAFGLGAIVIPSLVYGIGVAHLGTRLRQQLASWRAPVERLSAGLLVVAGIATLVR